VRRLNLPAMRALPFLIVFWTIPAFAMPGSDAISLDQGWSDKDRSWFYHVDQGSELIPFDIFANLEAAENDSLFFTEASIRSYGFLYAPGETLPIGFARHKEMLGLTCAACHTAQIAYHGKEIRIDGGPTIADMQGFLEALTQAARKNLDDNAKFERMARRLLGATSKRQDHENLRARLKHVVEERAEYDARNRPDSRYGHGRLDAFGRIYNRVLGLVCSKEFVRANAPVSYPFLWDAPRHDYVQWVGATSNAGAGALGRNVGQVVGVFGRVDISRRTVEPGYSSSIEIGNLMEIETRLTRLQSPVWADQILPKVDRKLAATGRKLYERDCLSCHADIKRADPGRSIRAQMFGLDIVGTDPLTAKNIVEYSGPTGTLKGRFVHFVGMPEIFGDTAPVTKILRNIVEGVLVHDPAKVVESSINPRIDFPKQGKYPVDSTNPLASLLAYKARPINGIWATSPYLHNGSVPTLYDLLLPARDRPRKFFTGNREFDPVNVGYVSDKGPFEFDTALPGNRNSGHEYGTSMSKADRMALLEYLKTL